MHLNKLKSGIKNGTQVTLKRSSNVFGYTNGELIPILAEEFFKVGVERIKGVAKRAAIVGKNVVPGLPEKSAESYFEKGINELNNKFSFGNNANKH